MQPAGQNPEGAPRARNGHSTALFAAECQSFLDNVIAGLGQTGSWHDPHRPAEVLDLPKSFGSYYTRRPIENCSIEGIGPAPHELQQEPASGSAILLGYRDWSCNTSYPSPRTLFCARLPDQRTLDALTGPRWFN